MQDQSQLSESKATRWFWFLFLGGFGLYSIVCFMESRAAHYVLSASGFLCMALFAYKNPVSFFKPLWSQIKQSRKNTSGTELLGAIGVALVVTAMVWRWYAP